MTDRRPLLLVVSPFRPETLEPLADSFEVVTWSSVSAAPQAFLADHGARVRALLTNGMLGVPEACRDALPALGLIACNGVGVDGIDLGWAGARGVRVTNTPDVLSADVADHALALVLAALRRVPQADRHVRDGAWEQGPFPLGRRFAGSRVGIVGLGRIGRLIARRAAAFDTEVAYTGRRPQADAPWHHEATPVALAAWADVLIVSTPGGPDTRHVIGATVLDALGPEGLLVNVARGSVVDQSALLSALESGRLGAAALDVFEDEPRVPAALRTRADVVLTPHIASATVQTRAAMAELVVRNLSAFARGQPLPTPVA